MPEIQERLHQVYKMKDMDDNILTLQWHPQGIYTIEIYLVKLKRTKKIAEVDIDHACMSMVRNKQKHYMTKMNGYGFNWTLINKSLPFYVKNILLIEHDAGETDYYLIPIDIVKSAGEKLHFSNSAGMELQWFMKMTDIIKYRLKGTTVLSKELIHKK